jgi:hypothetical protein
VTKFFRFKYSARPEPDDDEDVEDEDENGPAHVVAELKGLATQVEELTIG